MTSRSLVVALVMVMSFSVAIADAKPTTKPKPQGLWVGDDHFIADFKGAALERTGTPNPFLEFGSVDFALPLSIAFDPKNNSWISYSMVTGSTPFPILEITPGQRALLKNHHRIFAKVIYPPDSAGSLGFDDAGDLWASDYKAILEFVPRQLRKSGSPPPAISIISENFVPLALRFDRSNNLWVEESQVPFDPSNPVQIWKFAPADRTASGPANPSLTVNLPDQLYPVDFAFDSAGDMWIAALTSAGDGVEMFSANDLAGSGTTSPSPVETITSSAFGHLDGAGSCLGGIDFDSSGNLWVSAGNFGASVCASVAQVAEFTPEQLSTGGNLSPKVSIGPNLSRTNLSQPGPIRFGPIL